MFRLIISLATMLVITSVTAAFGQSHPYVAYLKGVEAEMIRDGDTPLIQIRKYGIDTPEKHQICERSNGVCRKCGKRTKQVLEGCYTIKRPDMNLRVHPLTGVLLPRFFIGSRDINLEMVHQGYAMAYTEFLDDSLKDKYLDPEKEARDLKRGIWQGNFIRPSRWRIGQRLPCE